MIRRLVLFSWLGIAMGLGAGCSTPAKPPVDPALVHETAWKYDDPRFTSTKVYRPRPNRGFG